MPTDPTQFAPAILDLAHKAGTAIMAVYATSFEQRSKQDHSPVTDADEKAEAIILAGLAALAPDIPIVAEEQAARGETPVVTGRRFWLVDPLDGTREFIDRNGEFTVNIALIENGVPVLGVVVAPALGQAWLGHGDRAWRHEGDSVVPIHVRRVPERGAHVLISRNHVDREIAGWIERQPEATRQTVGSSLKFCRIAEGTADLYPRFASISEWDTAAGQAVLEAAGGAVVTWQGERLRYGKPGFRNPGYLARGAA
ncbi:MAG: 3'(2'),5'-bisphosphate nucleotidase CysQ [Ferrovibrio sp.]|jgi:3'(2'), 5'-bisphosphate nucleotidase|uniref:3'(2'),5'-bisphosphate nucleotidase CysQ n=1 Tax=Ferrovibrio sp. TaxID=1917215 RepID=UPI003918D830